MQTPSNWHLEPQLLASGHSGKQAELLTAQPNTVDSINKQTILPRPSEEIGRKEGRV